MFRFPTEGLLAGYMLQESLCGVCSTQREHPWMLFPNAQRNWNPSSEYTIRPWHPFWQGRLELLRRLLFRVNRIWTVICREVDFCDWLNCRGRWHPELVKKPERSAEGERLSLTFCNRQVRHAFFYNVAGVLHQVNHVTDTNWMISKDAIASCKVVFSCFTWCWFFSWKHQTFTNDFSNCIYWSAQYFLELLCEGS